jgi:integrase/recombinase XerD
LYEAAGAADATACSGAIVRGGFEISWVTGKGGPSDPSTSKDAGRTEELRRRNYSHRTATTYVRIVREFAEHFHKSPDKLGPEHIRQFQAHLFQTKNLSPFTVSQYVSALRFLFVKTLRRHFLTEYIPFPKCPKRLPTVLSPEEVTRLINASRNLYHRTLLTTLYSTALRRAELCRLKVRDVDSQRMMIRIEQAAGIETSFRSLFTAFFVIAKGV